jgi:hypothetical protein
MGTQGSFWDNSGPYGADPVLRRYPDTPGYQPTDTSKAAAESMEPHVTRLAGLVLDYLKFRGARTCEEVEQGLGFRRSTASARITELKLKGKIEDTGERRPTESGRKAIVWRVK